MNIPIVLTVNNSYIKQLSCVIESIIALSNAKIITTHFIKKHLNKFSVRISNTKFGYLKLNLNFSNIHKMQTVLLY